MNQLDSKKCADRVKNATELAVQALQRYGEPTMSLEDLRATLDQELEGMSLSELILIERDSER